MIKLLANDDREIHGHLNFKRRVNANPMRPYGPTEGEYPQDVWAVAIDKTGKRVGYSFIPPGGYDE